MNAIRRWKNQSLSNKIFDVCNYMIMILVLITCLYPLYNVVIVSFSSQVTGVYFWPKDFTLEPYKMVLFSSNVAVCICFIQTGLYRWWTGNETDDGYYVYRWRFSSELFKYEPFRAVEYKIGSHFDWTYVNL